jgi:hypothetical protein
MIKALIFDFDGLIVDTEAPDYESWQQVYRLHGCDLAVEAWGQVVGGTGASDFDPHTNLEQLSGQPLDREEIWISRRKQYLDTITQQPILPGMLASLISAYYYLRLVVVMFMQDGDPQVVREPWMKFTALASALATVLLFVFSEPLFGWAAQAVLKLF